MSRSFATSGDYLYGPPAVLTYPYTQLCWFKLSSGDGLDHILIGLWSSVSSWRGTYMEVDNRGANYWRVQHTGTDNNNWSTIRTNVLFIDNDWNCGICVATSNTDRRVMVNNQGFWQDTTNRNPTPFTKTMIGGFTDATNHYAGSFPHKLAHGAIWNIELNSSDLTSIAAGRNPLTIQPTHLKGYWSLLNNALSEPDLSGNSNDMIIAGTAYSSDNPVVDTPPITGIVGGSSLLMVM